MEWRIEAKGSKWSETMIQSGNGHTIRSLPANEQFHTRSCARCAGLLVNEWCYDLDNTGEHDAQVLRCVQCGHRVDPVIVQNQIRPPGANGYGWRVQPALSVSMEMPSKVVGSTASR